MNADGSDPRQFIPNEGTAWDGQPAVSPDGSMVAFWHVNGSAQVAVAPADGTGEFVTTGPALPSTSHWVWAPDSSKILMWSDDAESTNAYLLDPAGGDWDTVPWRSDPDLNWQRVVAD
jgi:Tol biopolymer transport system component